jgi:hypothetical protein
MRISAFLRHLPLLLTITAPALLLAQFQQPTNEELNMTSDPKAPGAAAVFLNIEEINNDPQHSYSFYVRAKVLQEKGKELATVQLPYMQGNTRVADIKARTIHSDGTIIPLVGKPDDLLIVKMTSKEGYQRQANRKVFNLPSVEVGSILEYRFEIHYDDHHFSSPYWEIQRPYFVHKAHYSFTPFKAFLRGYQNSTSMYLVDAHLNKLDTLIWTGFLPMGVQVNSDPIGNLTLDLNDIPMAPNEEWMPPVQSTPFRVIFYYKSSKNPTEFWESEAKLWSQDVDHFAEPSMLIKDAAISRVAPGDSDLNKAKKLYKAVQALDNTDFSRKKNESELKQLNLKDVRRAEDTWVQKSGSRNDIALLYLAMLRAAGLTAYDMKVVDRSQRVFDSSYLRFDQLEDDIILLNSGGKLIALDPGQKMCPFQTLHWKHSGSTGVRQGATSPGLANSPFQAYTDNTTVRTGDVTLDEHGAMTGSLSIAMTGQEALRWRQTALRFDPDKVNKLFDRELESIVPTGVEAHIDRFTGLDDPDSDLVATVSLRGSLGAATSKRLLLPGFFFQTRGSHPFVNQEKRLEPVDMHYAEQTTDQFTYHLPANVTVEGAPQDAKIPWEGHAALVAKTKTEPGQITIARALWRAFTIVKPEDYFDLRDFYQKVAAADQAQLVLAKTPPATKGN